MNSVDYKEQIQVLLEKNKRTQEQLDCSTSRLKEVQDKEAKWRVEWEKLHAERAKLLGEIGSLNQVYTNAINEVKFLQEELAKSCEHWKDAQDKIHTLSQQLKRIESESVDFAHVIIIHGVKPADPSDESSCKCASCSETRRLMIEAGYIQPDSQDDRHVNPFERANKGE